MRHRPLGANRAQRFSFRDEHQVSRKDRPTVVGSNFDDVENDRRLAEYRLVSRPASGRVRRVSIAHRFARGGRGTLRLTGSAFGRVPGRAAGPRDDLCGVRVRAGQRDWAPAPCHRRRAALALVRRQAPRVHAKSLLVAAFVRWR